MTDHIPAAYRIGKSLFIDIKIQVFLRGIDDHSLIIAGKFEIDGKSPKGNPLAVLHDKGKDPLVKYKPCAVSFDREPLFP